MTERKKKKRDQVKRPETIREALGDMEKVFKFLEKEGLDLYGLLTVDLIIDAAERLRKAMKDSGAPGVSWAEPFLQIDYDIEPEELSAGEWLFQSGEDPDSLIDRIPEEEQRAYFENMTDAEFQAWLAQGSTRTMMISLFRVRTEDAVFIVNEDGEGPATGWRLPVELNAELDSMTEDEERAKMEEIAAGFVFRQEFPGMKTGPEGEEEAWNIALTYAIRPLTAIWEERAFFAVQVGLEYIEGDPSGWTAEEQAELWEHIAGWLDSLRKEIKQGGKDRIKDKEPTNKAQAVERFPVAGGYFQPIHRMTEKPEDAPLFAEWLEPQTPLNWAVAFALFSLTDIEKVDARGFQEASLADLEDRVYCLTERNAPRHGGHRQDILSEVAKLHREQRYYFNIETKQVGKAWKRTYAIGSGYAIPALELVFEDRRTGERAHPSNAIYREYREVMEIKGRRVYQPDRKREIMGLPKDRFRLVAIRWQWAESFNKDLLRLPALIESGKRKGLPKKTATGKTIRLGWTVRISNRVIDALRILRGEGSGSRYASNLLVLLASDIKKKGDEYNADKLFRQIGLDAPKKNLSLKEKKELIAAAILRLQQKDIGALLPGSDQSPRTEPNPDRRKGEYYRLKRSPEFAPVQGFATKAEAERIEAEFTEEEPPEKTKPEAVQGALLFGDEDENEAVELPAGAEIRAAREVAGVTLREFARMMDGPTFSTWSRYETGKPIRVGKISPGTWEKVWEFIAENVPEEPE